ncbi:YopX family protein [Bacillus rugosus]|uniref:YopX family protein n=1 Tax=Bacillus rugosus TaxID=2715209 RepID=UPI0035A3B98F
MREIKFRGMGINGEWYYGNLSIIKQRIKSMGIDPGSYISNKAGVPFAYSVRPETVGQYIGLKDANGREIYEGDILSTDLTRPYLIVEFRNGSFMVQCHDSDQDYYDYILPVSRNSSESIKYHEVIGNIYENPDLLEASHASK